LKEHDIEEKVSTTLVSEGMFLTSAQLFTVTTDNATSNDTMVEAIPADIDCFRGEPDHIRCFNHCINLIAKALLSLFDVPKGKQSSSGDKKLDVAEEELRRLGEDMELEDLRTQVADFHNTLTVEGVDDEEDAFDPITLLDTDEERASFRKDIVPVRTALVKVRKRLRLQV
jgi:hypothetical protein